jgi:NADH dehydrogenase [ubiquinone] 1 alpha subcomplex assembly factor 1
MALSKWSVYVNRSSKILREATSNSKVCKILGHTLADNILLKVLRMSGTDEPDRGPKTLFTFNRREDVENCALGSDADIGGYSTVHLDLDETKETNESIGKPATAKFWGHMKLDVKPQLQGKVRAGYAGFRNRVRAMGHLFWQRRVIAHWFSQRRPTLFGEMMEDVSLHDYLALRVRLGGHPQSRHSYFVNIQTDGAITTDLWQHRLYFNRDDGGWEDIFVSPLSSYHFLNLILKL